MKFEFNSLDELDGFVQYLFNARAHAAHIGKRPEFSAPYGEATVDQYPRAPMTSEDLERAIARTTGTLPVPDADHTPEQRAAAQAAHAGAPAQQGAGNESEPPRRKRRTKAEIEADKLAAAAHPAPAETNAPSDAQATAATSPLAGANPFDASTSNAPAATAALNEAPAGTTGTLSALGGTTVEERVLTLEAAAVAQAAKADAALEAAPTDLVGVDPQSYIALRVAEMGGAFDAREHMKKCVEFIGALGKARYDEAFDLAGTSRSVATYTPADCAKHIAALEYLQLSGKGA